MGVYVVIYSGYEIFSGLASTTHCHRHNSLWGRLSCHYTRQQCHTNLRGVVQPTLSVSLSSGGDTHEQTVSHLSEIHRPSRIKVHLRVDFYLESSVDRDPKKWRDSSIPFTLGRGCMIIISSFARERTEWSTRYRSLTFSHSSSFAKRSFCTLVT